MSWAQAYLDLPWAADPQPPHSFTCGELIRYVYRTFFGIQSTAIVADPESFRDCIDACSDLSPFGDFRVRSDRQDFDVVQLVRGRDPAHVGLWSAADGAVLHCVRGAGVCLDTPFELRHLGWRGLIFNRHADLLDGLPEVHRG